MIEQQQGFNLYCHDFSRAFDSVRHDSLLKVIHDNGITGKAGEAIQNWLVGRTQYVQIGKGKSQAKVVLASVIQGSVLGPTLVALFGDTTEMPQWQNPQLLLLR